MTYQEYLQAAKSCTTPDTAQKIIDMAADDNTLSAHQYFNVRYLAIKNAYTN